MGFQITLDLAMKAAEFWFEKYPEGIRTAIIGSYNIPKAFAETVKGCAVQRMQSLGALLWYADQCNYMGHKRRIKMDVDAMVEKWKVTVVGLVVAHNKDEADRYEASIEDCLTPILSAPIKQVREFAPKLVTALKSDQRVPFIVWRAYETWVENVIAKSSDEGVKELKTALAREIVNLVEEDCKNQLPEAMVRALQWRSPETLEKFKDVVKVEQAKGNKVRLRGRESCTFLECGGTEEDPAVCVQL